MTRDESEGRFRKFWAEMSNATYSPHFNSALEAIMDDPTALIRDRFWSWLIRYSWGNWCTFACELLVSGEKKPINQADCARRLDVDPRRISSVAHHETKRGRLEIQGHLLIPVRNPGLGQRAPTTGTPLWTEFLQEWKTAHSEEACRLDVLDSQVGAIKRLRLGAYKQWRRARATNELLHKGTRAKKNSEPFVQDSFVPRISSASVCLKTTTTTDGTGAAQAPKYTSAAAQALSTSETRSEAATSKMFREGRPLQKPVPEALACPPDPSPSAGEAEERRVGEAMEPYCGSIPDPPLVRGLIAQCLQNAPDCTADEIVYYVNAKGGRAMKATNPPKFLAMAVANCFLGEAFRKNRLLIAETSERQCAQEARAAAVRLHQEREGAVALLRISPDDEFAQVYSDEDRERARAVVRAALADPAVGDEARAALSRLLPG